MADGGRAATGDVPRGEESRDQMRHDVARESLSPGSMAEPGSSELAASTLHLVRVTKALRHRDFRYMWGGNFLSNIGTWMQNVAQGWLVLQITNSTFWLGIVSFAAALPMLLFTLVGGVIADNVDKRKMLIRTQTAMMCIAFLMAALSHFKVITVGQIIVLAFATGVASSLGAPSHQALVPQLVPRADLTNAIGLNSAQFNLSRVLGPTLGGFAMAWFGVSGNFFLNGLSFLAVIFSLTRIHYPAQSGFREGQVVERLAEGFRYVFHNPHTRVLVMLVCIGSFLGVPYLSFLPFFARDLLAVGERGLGFLMAFSGLGAFFAAVTVAYFGRFHRRGKLIVAAGLSFFTAIFLFTFSRSFMLSAALQLVIGFSMILMIAIINTRLQHLSSDEMRGRTMSIYATAYLGLPPIGSFMAGWLSRWISAPHAIAAMSTLGAVAFAAIYLRRKEFRDLD